MWIHILYPRNHLLSPCGGVRLLFFAELKAFVFLSPHLTLLTSHFKFLLLSDSLSSLLAMQNSQLYGSTHPHTSSHLNILFTNSVSFLCIPDPNHDVHDIVTKESLLSHTISFLYSPRPTICKNYYRSLILTSWQEFWTLQSSNNF